MLQIGQKTGKWQWHHNFSRWRHRQFFWLYFFSLVRFSYWSNIHVNTITSSGIMKISSYKGLTRNVDIGNTPIWVLPNIWRLEQVMDTKFGTNVSNRMLLNAAKFQGYSFYRFWVIKGKPTGGGGKITPPLPVPPRLGLRKVTVQESNLEGLLLQHLSTLNIGH